MRDTVDMLPAILNLAKKSMKNTITEQDYTKEVKEYEIKMSPCAFGWVKASGGSGELVDSLQSSCEKLKDPITDDM